METTPLSAPRTQSLRNWARPSLLTSVYVLFALLIVLLLTYAIYVYLTAPRLQERRVGHMQLRVLHLARTMIESELSDLGDRLVRLAKSPAIVNARPKAVASLAPDAELNLDLDQIKEFGGFTIRRLDENGAFVNEWSTVLRSIRVSEEQTRTLLEWARNPDNENSTLCELQDIPTGVEKTGRDLVRYCAGVWAKGAGAKPQFKGLLLFWFPGSQYFHEHLFPTHLLPESYSFVLHHGPLGKSEKPMALLWHWAEPSWSRDDGVDTSSFLKAVSPLTHVVENSGDDFSTLLIPQRDGSRRYEVTAIVKIVFGSQHWLLGLSTPHSVAVEFSGQSFVVMFVAVVAVGAVLIGVALLFYQRSRLADEATTVQRQQLREVQSQYRELFAENPTAMLVFNDDSKLVDCNYSAERLLGIARQEAVGERLDQLLEGESVKTAWATLTDRGNLSTFETRFQRRDDQTNLLVELWGRRIGDRWVLMAHDVEQRRELAQQISRLKRMDSMGALASTLTHDFNNMLGQIQILVSNLRSELPIDSNLLSDLAAIEDKVDDASKLAANLMAMREDIVSSEPVPLDSVLRDFLTNEQKVLPANIQFQEEIPTKLPDVWITPHSLRRVLNNLWLNACDAMPYGGVLRIRATTRTIQSAESSDQLPKGNYAIVEVSDTGTGIAPEILDNIFEPFFTTKEVGKGTGLGLWTVYKTIRSAKGWVHVQSRPGKGTRFTIYLPTTPGMTG